MTHEIGTLAWIEESQGLLRPADSRRLMVRGLLLQLRLIPEQWIYRLGLRRPSRLNLDLDALDPPDSVAADRAASLCREASPPFLFAHCQRSYLWARLFALLYGLEIDVELLFVAVMLHDIGLTETHGAMENRPHCFSAIGAQQANELLATAGWDSRRRDAVSEAITLHLNLAVDLKHGPEAHLLNQATALDVTGLRLWKFQPAVIEKIIEAHPRLDQKATLPACWRREAQRFPTSRTDWLEKHLHFSRRVAAAPFKD